jgi:hypothetical protein
MSEKKIVGLDDDYPIFYKDVQDIVSELKCSDIDKLITRDIMLNIEAQVANVISNGGAANIPFLGNLRKNPLKYAIHKTKEEFANARNTLNPEDYKQFWKDKLKVLKSEIDTKQTLNRELRKFKANNKTYKRILVTHGTRYANLWIYAATHLHSIPFDPEVEEAFERIRTQQTN